MIILAVYYTFADIVLIAQCFYYRGFTLSDPDPRKLAQTSNGGLTESSPLLVDEQRDAVAYTESRQSDQDPVDRIRTQSSYLDGGHHLSPATPMHPQPKDADHAAALRPSQPRSWTQAILFNSTAIVVVVLAGIAGYYLSPTEPERKDRPTTPADEQADSLQFNAWGQFFGYICAVLYLGSRIPQLLLNYRRKSTEGLNALFFMFACIGNLTYVFSIFAFSPICSNHYHGHWHESNCEPGEAVQVYGRYILVNLSWLIGSAGTLFLDFAVFVQFFMYRNNVSDANGNIAREDSQSDDR